MVSLFEILFLVLGVTKFVIFVHFILSWLVAFQILNMHQPLVMQIWSGLEQLLNPIYQPIRRILPPLGGFDLAPLIALLAVHALTIVLRNNAAAFSV